jgi:ketosteroid isomerase-like protein
MTFDATTTPVPDTSTDGRSPHFAAAGRFVDGLAVRDFDAMADAVATDVRFRALLPQRTLDLEGRDALRSAFATWFASAAHWELVDVVIGEVGDRVHLRWRLRVTKPELGPGTYVVEQQVYADLDRHGTLSDVALLCTGFRPEPS